MTRAYKLMNDGPELYMCDAFTITVPRRDGSYAGVLNSVGESMYAAVLERARRGDFTGRLSPHLVIDVASGFWVPDKHSKYYNPQDAIHLNAFNNKVIVGDLGNRVVTTSIVVFLTEEFAYTQSGSLYALGEVGDPAAAGVPTTETT